MILCKNAPEPTDCLNYVIPYQNNFRYVSQGLLDIINAHILPDVEAIFVELVDEDCNCLPICEPGVTTDCLPTSDEGNVFSCETWASIKKKLIIVSEDSADEAGLLPVLYRTLNCILQKKSNINYGLASQLERFLCLTHSLETRLDSVCCNSKCPELVGDLLCLLMQILTKLISAVTKTATLIYYSNPDGCELNVGITVSSFVECMVCDLVNDLHDLELLIPELSAIVVGFATCDAQACTPCYTASCAPRKVRPTCPTSAMNPAMGCNPGFNTGFNKGCSCSCKR